MPREKDLPLLPAAMRFALWAAMHKHPPSWREVQGFLGCTSSKARKWRRAYLKAVSFPYPSSPAATSNTQQQETSHE